MDLLDTPGENSAMDDSQDDILLDAIDSVAIDVLEALGNDNDARYDFFHQFVSLAIDIKRSHRGYREAQED